ESHIKIETFQKALEGSVYHLLPIGSNEEPHHHHPQKQNNTKGTGVFYCPMHCEGDKTYDKPGNCPVCGMDLVEEQNLKISSDTEWTCPMHPEIVKEEPGDCPICGMDLVPKKPDLSAEEKTF